MSVSIFNGCAHGEAGLHHLNMQEKKVRDAQISALASLAIVGSIFYLFHHYEMLPHLMLVSPAIILWLHSYLPTAPTASQKLAEIAKRHGIFGCQQQPVEYLVSQEALEIPAYRELNPWIYGRSMLSQEHMHAAVVEAAERGQLVLLNFFLGTYLRNQHFLTPFVLVPALDEAVKEGHEETVKFLINVMRDEIIGLGEVGLVSTITDQLSKAARGGRLRMMGCLLSFVRITERIDQQIDRAFLSAVRRGLIEEVRFAISTKRAWGCQLLKTALEEAASYRHSAIIALLEPQNLQLGGD